MSLQEEKEMSNQEEETSNKKTRQDCLRTWVSQKKRPTA